MLFRRLKGSDSPEGPQKWLTFLGSHWNPHQCAQGPAFLIQLLVKTPRSHFPTDHVAFRGEHSLPGDIGQRFLFANLNAFQNNYFSCSITFAHYLVGSDFESFLDGHMRCVTLHFCNFFTVLRIGKRKWPLKRTKSLVGIISLLCPGQYLHTGHFAFY